MIKRIMLLLTAVAIVASMLTVGQALAIEINPNACTKGDADQKSPRISEKEAESKAGVPEVICTVQTGP